MVADSAGHRSGGGDARPPAVGGRRRGCSCSKEDFEESFRSWASYRRPLGETGARLRDRLTTRSLEQAELTEVRARSGHDMKRNLSWWDLIWFGIGAVIGAGIFVLTGQEARTASGPAVILSYIVSGVSAMLSVFCFTEFAVEIPVAGYYLYGDDDERSKGNWKLINEGLVLDIGPGGTAKHLKGISTASLPNAGMGPDMEPFKRTIAMDNSQIFMEASNWAATIDHQVLVKDYRSPTIINVKACGWGATIDSHVLTGANWDAIMDHAQVVKEACGFGTALCGQVVMKASWCATIDHAQVLMEAHDFGTIGDWVGPCNVQFLLEMGQGSATS